MTVQEDNFLVENFGRERHFSVPNDYFAQFHKQMMEQVRAEAAEDDSPANVVTMRRRSVWRTVISAAACVAAVAVMAGAYLHENRPTDGGAASAPSVAKAQGGGDAIDQAADYMMLDETDLYAYMSEY